MSDSSSSLNYKYRISGTLFVVLATASITPIPLADHSPALIQKGVLSTANFSKAINVPGEIKSWEEIRIAKIKAMRGKYRNFLTNSSSFAQQKREEIAIEE